MTPAGALIIATLLGTGWAAAVVARWSGIRKAKKDAAQDDKTYIAKNIGSGIGGDLYRGASRLDAAVERATRPADDFLAMLNCPNCNCFGLHHITKSNKRFVWRECINDRCQKKWKQAR